MVKKQNIANAGEFHIASLLSAYDCVATITLGRAEGFDLLVVNPKGHPLKIQVKTRFSSDIKEFILNEKAENIKDDDFFYVFVRLNKFKTIPDYWVVPAKDLAEIVKSSHKAWLTTPGIKGQQHQDTKMRGFNIIQRKYLPANWETRINKYYMNIQVILDF